MGVHGQARPAPWHPEVPASPPSGATGVSYLQGGDRIGREGAHSLLLEDQLIPGAASSFQAAKVSGW